MNPAMGLITVIVCLISFVIGVHSGSVAAWVVFFLSALSIWTDEFK